MAYAELICRICESKFKQEKRFIEHMVHDHAIVADESYFCNVNGIEPLTCSCRCGTKLPWKGWKIGYSSSYVRGHNAVDDTIFRTRADELAQKRKEAYRSGKRTVWNTGLTKGSSTKLQKIYDQVSTTLKNRYESGELVPWQALGDRSESFKKISSTKRKSYSEGLTSPWNLGLTKESDERIARGAAKISESYILNGRSAGRRLSPEEFESRFSLALSTFEPLVTWDEFYRTKLDRFPVKCRICGETSSKTLYMLETCPVCHVCNPIGSKPQLEIFDYVSSLGFTATLSDRKRVPGYELDVYVQSANVAFEMNGLYWHNEEHRPRTYHSTKSRVCRDAGVRVIHIFSDEWQMKRSIIESIIQHSLGVSPAKINARSCSVKVLGTGERRAFFDANHLDGDVRSTFAVGLIYDGKIVSAISLRKPVHAKYSGLLEVARFCSRVGTVVRGALSRLTMLTLDYAQSRGIQTLLSYVDTRFGVGRGYENVGWKYVGKTSPRFWWTDNTRRYDRFSCRADRNAGLTEMQVASSRGLKKIWGCENLIYQFTKS